MPLLLEWISSDLHQPFCQCGAKKRENRFRVWSKLLLPGTIPLSCAPSPRSSPILLPVLPSHTLPASCDGLPASAQVTLCGSMLKLMHSFLAMSPEWLPMLHCLQACKGTYTVRHAFMLSWWPVRIGLLDLLHKMGTLAFTPDCSPRNISQLTWTKSKLYECHVNHKSGINMNLWRWISEAECNSLITHT